MDSQQSNHGLPQAILFVIISYLKSYFLLLRHVFKKNYHSYFLPNTLFGYIKEEYITSNKLTIVEGEISDVPK